jgi:predicted DNA-binding transcriptional regulator YafY
MIVKGILDTAWAQSLQEAEPAMPDLAFNPQPDGTLKVKFQATDLHAPLRWALQFGPRAKLTGPPEARRKIVENLKAALALYENDENMEHP